MFPTSNPPPGAGGYSALSGMNAGSSLGLGSSAPQTSGGTASKGALISLEAFNEWQIQEIGYNGVEKYIRPQSFSDNVSKLARKVDWKKLVGSDAVYDNPSLVEDDDDETEEEEEEKPVEEKTSAPDAGPWHSVAKNLHESLQQLNILLDNLRVARHTEYVRPLTVLEQQMPESQLLEHLNNGKAAQWVWKRKALTEALRVLESAQQQRSVDGDASGNGGGKPDLFFAELKKMRECWRVRKTGDHIYGDLGYHIFGGKYNANELFDISRRSLVSGQPIDPELGVLQVTVPCDLARRATLSVSIVKDDECAGVWADSDVLDAAPMERKHAEQLCSEAVRQKTRSAVIRDGVLLVGLHDDLLLRVQLRYHPFKDVALPCEGDRYLTRTLRQMVVAEQCTRWVRPQMFVALPLTTLPPSLDVRGPAAITEQEMESRARHNVPLVERLAETAAHQVLVRQTVELLTAHVAAESDPQMTWRWMRAAATNSQLIVHMTNRNYDYIMGKVTFYIRISCEGVEVVNKEGHAIACHRQPRLLLNALKLMNCNFFVQTIAALGKTHWSYQVLHANMNAVDSDANPAPTVYLCNPASTRCILVQFSINHPPVIKEQRKCNEKKEKTLRLRRSEVALTDTEAKLNKLSNDASRLRGQLDSECVLRAEAEESRLNLVKHNDRLQKSLDEMESAVSTQSSRIVLLEKREKEAQASMEALEA